MPINVAFTLHRLNEFMMLMLGETILSITISPVPFQSDFDSAEWHGAHTPAAPRAARRAIRSHAPLTVRER